MHYMEYIFEWSLLRIGMIDRREIKYESEKNVFG